MSIEDLIKLADSREISQKDIEELNSRLDNFEFNVSRPINLDLIYNI